MKLPSKDLKYLKAKRDELKYLEKYNMGYWETSTGTSFHLLDMIERQQKALALAIEQRDENWTDLYSPKEIDEYNAEIKAVLNGET
jgi:hypothetical protein